MGNLLHLSRIIHENVAEIDISETNGRVEVVVKALHDEGIAVNKHRIKGYLEKVNISSKLLNKISFNNNNIIKFVSPIKCVVVSIEVKINNGENSVSIGIDYCDGPPYNEELDEIFSARTSW
ncbi:hypothetical protein PYJP_09660 [Pyrofollis japonicus]|uniref:hypothetical protein n=1 Tax=Pyrofollis japonicus TaxID=3060460 RepID=UPI00295B67CE|nr:hypothetical protein [Pyrofollis japonicus]BEP17614.1 hypothetical protein PYJP_09660 [Pyrofollis japonicus]